MSEESDLILDAECGACGKTFSISVSGLTAILRCSYCGAESRTPEFILQMVGRHAPGRVHPVFGELTPVGDAGWEGSREIECGEVGILPLKFRLDHPPTEIQADNYAAIVERWPRLWPGLSALMIGMLREYGRDYDLEPSTTFLELEVPEEPMGSQAKWSIAVTFEPEDGIWIIPFRDWEVLENEAQPMF